VCGTTAGVGDRVTKPLPVGPKSSPRIPGSNHLPRGKEKRKKKSFLERVHPTGVAELLQELEGNFCGKARGSRKDFKMAAWGGERVRPFACYKKKHAMCASLAQSRDDTRPH